MNPALADMTARRDRLAEKVGDLALSLAQAGERERRLTAALAARDAMLAEAREALAIIGDGYVPEVTAEMVERACEAWFGEGNWWFGYANPIVDVDLSNRLAAKHRADMRAALTAALPAPEVTEEMVRRAATAMRAAWGRPSNMGAYCNPDEMARAALVAALRGRGAGNAKEGDHG